MIVLSGPRPRTRGTPAPRAALKAARRGEAPRSPATALGSATGRRGRRVRAGSLARVRAAAREKKPRASTRYALSSFSTRSPISDVFNTPAASDGILPEARSDAIASSIARAAAASPT